MGISEHDGRSSESSGAATNSDDIPIGDIAPGQPFENVHVMRDGGRPEGPGKVRFTADAVFWEADSSSECTWTCRYAEMTLHAIATESCEEAAAYVMVQLGEECQEVRLLCSDDAVLWAMYDAFSEGSGRCVTVADDGADEGADAEDSQAAPVLSFENGDDHSGDNDAMMGTMMGGFPSLPSEENDQDDERWQDAEEDAGEDAQVDDDAEDGTHSSGPAP